LDVESALLPSQIEQLPDLAGYLKFASDPRWRRITLNPAAAAAADRKAGAAPARSTATASAPAHGCANAPAPLATPAAKPERRDGWGLE
jgi:hypothetical protein